MKRLSARLCLPLVCAAGLAACGSASLHQQGAEQRAADAAAARTLAAGAPPDSQPEALAPWLQAERSRIDVARQQAEQRFAAAEKACWQRFAVNACLRQARSERRAVIDRLRQQELALNEVERRRSSAERLRQLDDKQRAQGDSARP